MINVAVTGVTGKTGQYFLQELVRNAESLKDCHFRFSVREHSRGRIPQTLPFSFETAVGDLLDKDFIADFLHFDTGTTTLLHIAGIGGSVPLVRQAVKSGVKRLILVHTSGVFSKYRSASETYSKIEARVRELTENTDISVTILRPTMIYGNLNDGNIAVFIRMVDTFRLFPTVSGGKALLQPVWCGDLGRAYFDVLFNPEKTNGKDYILSGGAPIRLIDIFRTIEACLGRKNIYFFVPYPIAYAGACALYGLSMKKKDYREKVMRLVESRAYGYEEAARDFGYAPVTFDQGVREEAEMYLRAKNGGFK